MKNLVPFLIGLTLIVYPFYILVWTIKCFLGYDTWDGLGWHWLFISVIAVMMLLQHSNEKKQAPKEEDESKTPEPTEEQPQETTNHYNPIIDKLHFDVYRESFETWWYDNDGDRHHHSTIFANLRFYADGTVIGIRSNVIPKKDVEESFTMQGKWTLNENQLNLNLEKTSAIDDRIQINIDDEDRRQMKYYGEIADDHSLIKSGQHKGIIRENEIHIGSHIFTKIAVMTLIITASESCCYDLENRIKDHPHVIDTFQNSGFWYSNGETGPEWFTLHVEAEEQWKTVVENLVNQELKKMGKHANFYWQ